LGTSHNSRSPIIGSVIGRNGSATGRDFDFYFYYVLDNAFYSYSRNHR